MFLNKFKLYSLIVYRKRLKEGQKGSTGNLHNHLRLVHASTYAEFSSSNPSKKPRVTQRALLEHVLTGKPKEKLTRDGFIEKLIDFAVLTDQPFNVVDNPNFSELLDYISKDVAATVLPGRKGFTTEIEKKYGIMKRKVKELLENAGSRCSLVIDGWTSANQLAFQGVIIRFIDRNWILFNIPIDVTPLSGPHNGANIADALYKVLQEYEITSKVLSITTDNATNMDTFFDAFQVMLEEKLGVPFDKENQRIRCLAHIVNLCAKDIMRNVDETESTKSIIEKLRKGVIGIRGSPQRREIYLRNCTENGIGDLLPIQDVPTRWNSTFDMIERALRIETAFTATLKTIGELRSYILSEQDWALLKQLMDFLAPLKQATQMISKETAPNIASSTMIYNYLLKHFEDATTKKRREKNRNPDWLVDSAKKGLVKLEKYYPESDGKVYVIGTILHPGFKLDWYKHANWPEKWISNCKNIIFKEWNDYYKPKSSAPATSTETNSEGLDFFSALYNSQMANTSTSVKDELKKYLSEPTLKDPLKEDGLLTWWKCHELEYPYLSKMARDYLAVAGSGVPVERLFSLGSDTISDDRYSLSSDHIRMLMCLKCWLKSNI